MKIKRTQYYIYLIYIGMSSFLFELVFTANELYRIEIAHFNEFQLVIVGTVLELTCFIFEIPTGIMADLKSRKLSVVIGLILIGCGFFLEGLISSFIIILFSQIIWGIGATFTSGADEAWISDELEGKGLENVFLRGAQVGQFGALIAIGVSIFIGAFSLNLPLIIGGLSFIVLAIFLNFNMPETQFKRVEKLNRGIFKQMGETFTQGFNSIKQKRLLILFVFVALFYGLYSEGLDRLWILHILGRVKETNIKPIYWVGLINATPLLLSIITVEYIKRRVKKTGSLEKVGILILINFFMVISIICFGLAKQFSLAISSYLLFYILRQTNGPIYRAWLNQNIDSSVRATVLSTYSQIDALGQILSGPIIGFIAFKFTTGISIITSGIILLPVVIIYISIFFLHKKMKLN